MQNRSRRAAELADGGELVATSKRGNHIFAKFQELPLESGVWHAERTVERRMMRSPENEYEERIARLLSLATSAQDASDRAQSLELRETYLRLAGQWAELASMTEGIAGPGRAKHSGENPAID